MTNIENKKRQHTIYKLLTNTIKIYKQNYFNKVDILLLIISF